MTRPVHWDRDLGEALRRTLHRRAVAEGTMTLPAVPALLDEYVNLCLTSFGAIGVEFDDPQQAGLRDTIAEQLEIAFTASPRSEIVITYSAPVGQIVNYQVRPQWASIEKTYDDWVVTREPPYFGAEPDARVWALALEHADPRGCPVLDIGAGAGRNSLALARRGHPVDALEVSGQLADVLREEARQRSLGIRVIQHDLFTARDCLPGDYHLVIVSEVTSDFRSTEELQRVFALASDALVPGGQLVLNAFIADDDYEPDSAAREIGQQTYSAVFTRKEIEQATAGWPLTLIDEVSVYDYEHEHLPPESWPPTGWYEGWVLGRDVFGLDRPSTPMEMRWLVYRKSGQVSS